jgi:hypothetical protein
MSGFGELYLKNMLKENHLDRIGFRFYKIFEKRSLTHKSLGYTWLR